jgi:hypothetical protein
MKIVVLSTDTEHYLLQWWLPHSAKKFDLGVIVDFNWEDDSEDTTYELYKKHVPHWRYLKVKREKIGTFLWDVVLSKIEKDLLNEFPGSWITSLNATEFLIGDLSFLDNIKVNRQVLIPCHLMIDSAENEGVDPDPNLPLLEQRYHGVHYKNDYPHPHRGKSFQLWKEQNPPNIVLNTRWMRSIHNYNVDYLGASIYSVGRHFWDLTRTTDQLAICHMNLSPYTKSFFDRKKNIQRRLTSHDLQADRGVHHRTDDTKLEIHKRFYDQLAIDLSSDIRKLESNE